MLTLSVIQDFPGDRFELLLRNVEQQVARTMNW
jgi:hypothetical protein